MEAPRRKRIEEEAIQSLKERFYYKLGKRVKSLKEAKSLDATQLAAKLGMTQNDWLKMESGDIQLSFHQVITLAKAFKLSPADFFTGVDSEKQIKGS